MNNDNLLSEASYSRTYAVNYAFRYAMHPNPQYRYFPLIGNSSGDCANFISQCLRAGGAPMTNSWWYNNKGTANVYDDSWSIPWTVAHSLYWRLKQNYQSRLRGPKGQEVSSPNQLQLGDVIFYEDEKGIIFHSAIVTGFSGVPLVSHHSYEAVNKPYYRSYVAKKFHFMRISV